MNPITTHISILVCACLVFSAGGSFVSSAAEPTIDIEINNEQFTDGSEIDVRSNPTVDISVTADTQINLVELYVDGAARRTFDPTNTSLEREFQLHINNGEHDIQVIAGANETTTINGMITKDGGAPFIGYTEPFKTSNKSIPPDVATVPQAQVNLSGYLFDDSSVQSVEIERRFNYSYAGSRETSRANHEITDPGDSFQQKLLLGNGDNEITATYIDEMGNQRRHDFSLVVDDQRAPQIDTSAPTQVTEPSASIGVTVTDNVKIKSVIITSPNLGTKTLVLDRSPKPNTDRLQVNVQENIDLSEGRNEIDIEATDVNGNTVSKKLPIEYIPIIQPTIEIDAANTRVENNSIFVRGRIFQGEVTRASIQTRPESESSSETVDIKGVYTGDSVVETVTINQTLTLAPNETVTEIRVLATDSEGIQHERSVWANSNTGAIGDSPSAVDDSSSLDTALTSEPSQQSDTNTDTETNDASSQATIETDTPVSTETEPDYVTPISTPGFGIIRFGIIITIIVISFTFIGLSGQ
ncbi:hypothetical protein [Haloquadratum walsbyi]|uniref:Secreted glycoprotein n=1 Tax=Haloquadratum walsbyi J07HQW2 TaxID=1238425 RepID=U1N2C6_9EURY|nr:hypothetical protein [Haloquadratum walsbyi]ERG97029.1 MAG: hypothetical protein J07HQW2_03515 [Haloquadratum walsbyi J07HQW2]